MNDFNPTDQPIDPIDPQDPQRPFAFCQTCGKPLDNETARRVGSAVYCEPCLDARLHAAPPPPAGGSVPPPYGGGYGPVNTGGAPLGGTPPAAGAYGFPSVSGEPNPGIAALLGLIPGVGAMYNEQYAKGIVHLLIFAVLVLFSHTSGIFGLFVMGWICYMSIEAHHTARARRDGTPLPNPFGFNDIGERMGFGKAWPSPDVAAAARDAVNAAAAGINSAAAGFSASRPVNTPPVANTPSPAWGSPIITPPPAGTPGWGAPVDAYPPAAAHGAAYTPPYNAAYTNPNPATPPPYSSTFVPPATAIPPITPVSRFPMGAILLIGFGLLFLLGTMGIFNAVPGSALLGVALLGFGAWLFLRRMMETGLSFTDDGTAGYRLRVLRALRGSVWLIALGIFSLLDSFNLVRWENSWPWFIILAGVMMLLQRTAYNSAATFTPPVPPQPPATPPAADFSEGGR